jgi:hypothetical protein
MGSRNGLRNGSIPLILGAASALGIVAVSTMFMTNSNRRLEKRAELQEKANAIATASVEEVILKIMNNSAGFVVPKKGEAHVKETHVPAATIMMYEVAEGVQVDPVKVYARRLQVPIHDDQERDRFYGYLSMGPRFAPNHDPNWRASITDQRVAKLIKPAEGITPSAAARTELETQFPKSQLQSDPIVAELATLTPIPAGQEGKDPSQPSAAAQTLAAQLQRGPQTKITQTAAKVDQRCGQVAPPTGQLGAVGMVALGQELRNLIKNGAAAKTGMGKTLAARPAGQLNAKVLAALLKSGCLERDTFLVTLEGMATVDKAGIKVAAPVTTNRVVEQSRFDHVGNFVYGQFLAYLHVHYNLSYDDMLALGWVNKNGEVVPESVYPELIAKNNLRTNPQPWPFQIAKSAVLRK